MFAHNASVCQKSCHAGFLCPGAQLPSDVAVWASAKIIEDNSIRCRAIHMGHKYLSYSYCRWPLSRRLLVALWSSIKHEKTKNMDSGLWFFLYVTRHVYEYCKSSAMTEIWSECVKVFWMLGGRCTHYTISLPSMDTSGPSFKVCVHPADHQSPLALSAPLCDLCVSALVNSCPGPALLRSTLMSNPILCPPSVHGAALPVMNIQRSAYLTGLSPLSKPLGTILQPQKNTLNRSSSLPLCFFGFPLLPHSLLSLSI